MALDVLTVTLVLGLVGALIGGIVGLKLLSIKGSTMENSVFNNRLQLLTDENKELKKFLASVKGKLNQMKQGITLDDNVNVEELDKLDNGAVDGVIKGLIAKYQHMAPPQLRPLLNDPAIVSFLLSQAKEHPEQTKEVLKHFIGSNGKIGSQGVSDESESNKIAAYASEGA